MNDVEEFGHPRLPGGREPQIIAEIDRALTETGQGDGLAVSRCTPL
ncbi:hypothetical protein ACIGZH_25910 [Streptomyces sp. NPDC058319]